MNNKIPSKIKNLIWLKEKGFKIKPFFVIDELIIKSIELEIEKIIHFFQAQEVESVIIRSASCREDSDDKSQAGFFESSGEILLKNLTAQRVLSLWLVNKKKAKQIKCSELYLFIQQYIQADYWGVIFSQQIYDQDRASLMLSTLPGAITGGKNAEKNVTYNKKNNQWINQDILSGSLEKKLSGIIFTAEEKFPEGADIELGIKENDVELFQIRPINRNKDEKILLFERQRLKDVFGVNFEKQSWVKNAFTQALGDLTPLSLSFYNYLLNSEEVYCLLRKAGFIDKRMDTDINYRILENIGNRTFYNTCQEKLLFPKQTSRWPNFKRIIHISIQEDILREEGLKLSNIELSINNCFAWLFLSGIYLQIFIEKEKQKYDSGSFSEKLRNTEIICGASRPHFQEASSISIDEFIKKYYYWADYPYELANIRISEQDKDEIAKIYAYFNRKDKKADVNNCLGRKVQFWLKQRILRKEKFLKSLFMERGQLIRTYKKDIFKATNWEGIVKKGEEPLLQNGFLGDDNEKLSNAFSAISGENYPYSKRGARELIIMPGTIDLQNVAYLTEEDDIKRYIGRYIAIYSFPNKWIPFIPRLKGIILKEGNELSHMAIACREYRIPCRVGFSSQFNNNS
ncbi:MAG: PEP-utilizing enzyme [Candidatus Omnitrophota bacterium]